MLRRARGLSVRGVPGSDLGREICLSSLGDSNMGFVGREGIPETLLLQQGNEGLRA